MLHSCNILAVIFLISELLIAFKGGFDGFLGGVAEAVLIQSADACDGAAAGGTDSVLQFSGVLAGLQDHLC